MWKRLILGQLTNFETALIQDTDGGNAMHE